MMHTGHDPSYKRFVAVLAPNAYHASEGDDNGEKLPLVPDEHAVGDARKLRLELVLMK